MLILLNAMSLIGNPFFGVTFWMMEKKEGRRRIKAYKNPTNRLIKCFYPSVS